MRTARVRAARPGARRARPGARRARRGATVRVQSGPVLPRVAPPGAASARVCGGRPAGGRARAHSPSRARRRARARARERVRAGARARPRAPGVRRPGSGSPTSHKFPPWMVFSC